MTEKCVNMGGVIVRTCWPRHSRRLRPLAGLLLAGLAAFPVAGAQTTGAPFGLKLPPGYMDRFGATAVMASSTSGFGVRYLPLPLAADLRVSLVKTPASLDYGLSGNLGTLNVAVGVFSGMPRAEMGQNLPSGVQWSGLVQGPEGLSRLTFGYALTQNEGRFRLLNAVGLAARSALSAPYSYSEVSNFAPRSFGKVNAALGTTGRLYTFPAQQEAQASFDLNLSANYSPLPGLLLEGSHLERFAAGSVPIADFGLGRYEESNFNVTYRLPGPDSALRLGAVRSRLARNWTADYTYLYGDVLLRTSALPSMFGPSLGYQWGPGGRDAHWLISLVSLPK
jgi:hypothetical protein